ncbi:hypothetical protein [Rhizobium tropici]|uniref:hypothetical protein n=1 Tax=Rhizobium tropici TaxID=398 RepID=UPI001AEE24C1|nr:hypothetical protein [Rhizobium tropici]
MAWPVNDGHLPSGALQSLSAGVLWIDADPVGNDIGHSGIGLNGTTVPHHHQETLRHHAWSEGPGAAPNRKEIRS